MKNLVLMATVFTCLLGCSSGAKEQVIHSDPPSLPKPGLTVAEIKSTPDDKVEDRIVDECDARMREPGDEQAIFSRFPKGLKMIYATRKMEDEVNNGGFHQFFWNLNGEYAQDALVGLNLISAKADADLLEKALAEYRIEKPRMDALAKSGTMDDFSKSERASKFDALNKSFYDHGDDLPKLRLK